MAALFGESQPLSEKMGLAVNGFGEESETKSDNREVYVDVKLVCEVC